MSNEEIKAIEYLSLLIPVNLNDARERILLFRAIEYAGIYNYTIDVKSREESVNNDIFLTRAKYYFLRKRLNPLKDLETYRQIEAQEHREVFYLKSKYSPSLPPISNK